jgi:putative PIN family toxin of toxin-antitoxin system
MVSALLFDQSKPAQAFNAALDRGSILLSHSVLKELTEVLGRKKLHPYLVPEEREQFIIALLILKESLFIDTNETIQVCRDPKDDKILELAVNGRADCIITGDKDLLILNPFRKIPIIKPDEFLTSITSHNQVQQYRNGEGWKGRG